MTKLYERDLLKFKEGEFGGLGSYNKYLGILSYNFGFYVLD